MTAAASRREAAGSLCAEALCLAVMALLPLGGCGISVPMGNQSFEAMVGYASCNASTRTSHRWIPGVDLRLAGPRTGLAVGWSETAVYEPTSATDREGRAEGTSSSTPAVPEGAEAGQPDRAGRDGFAPPLAWTWHDGDGTRRWLGWAAYRCPAPRSPVLFVHQSYAGMSANLSGAAAGLRVGLGRVTALQAEPGTDGVYVLRYQSRRPGAGSLTHNSEGGN